MAVDVGLKGGIITGGLGRPACLGMIINTPFQLACFRVKPFVPPIGGSIPLEPGEIHGFYQPVDPSMFGDFVDPSVYGKKYVKVTITSRFFKGEKEYLVDAEKIKIIIKIANLINRTKEKIKVTAGNIRRISTRASAVVKNLRHKDKENK